MRSMESPKLSNIIQLSAIHQSKSLFCRSLDNSVEKANKFDQSIYERTIVDELSEEKQLSDCLKRSNAKIWDASSISDLLHNSSASKETDCSLHRSKNHNSPKDSSLIDDMLLDDMLFSDSESTEC